ncbi:hypothetical protein Q8F55_000074 [Vanrija albida]|uniref:Granulins domain-containing protein n=1 Tax=Vanrija albida TaxID=181172 RepID=A0ABR3QC78_9TREE
MLAPTLLAALVAASAVLAAPVDPVATKVPCPTGWLTCSPGACALPNRNEYCCGDRVCRVPCPPRKVCGTPWTPDKLQ